MAAPASAATFSLVNDFGNPVFQYGSVGGGTFTPFALSDCSDIGVTGPCYRGADKFQVEFQRSATDLLIHPGPNDMQNSMVAFTAPQTGNYTFNTLFTRGDTGDGVNVFGFNNNALTLLGRVDGANPTFNFGGTLFLTQGQQFGFGTDRGGANSNYFNDSTLLSGTITGAVPEPATWAMMLIGFGTVGYALRRKKNKMRTHRCLCIT